MCRRAMLEKIKRLRATGTLSECVRLWSASRYRRNERGRPRPRYRHERPTEMKASGYPSTRQMRAIPGRTRKYRCGLVAVAMRSIVRGGHGQLRRFLPGFCAKPEGSTIHFRHHLTLEIWRLHCRASDRQAYSVLFPWHGTTDHYPSGASSSSSPPAAPRWQR